MFNITVDTIKTSLNSDLCQLKSLVSSLDTPGDVDTLLKGLSIAGKTFCEVFLCDGRIAGSTLSVLCTESASVGVGITTLRDVAASLSRKTAATNRWYCLPRNLLHHVVKMLGMPELQAVTTVCSSWNKMGVEVPAWKTLYMKHWSLRSSTQEAINMDDEESCNWRQKVARHRVIDTNWCKGHPAPEVRLKSHQSEVTAVSADPSSNRVVSGGSDHLVKLWSARRRICLRTFDGHDATVTAVQYLTGKRILSADSDGKMIVWNGEGKMAKIQAHIGGVFCMQANDQWIVTGGHDGAVHLWDTPTGKLLSSVLSPREARAVFSLALDEAGPILGVGIQQESSRMFDLRTCPASEVAILPEIGQYYYNKSLQPATAISIDHGMHTLVQGSDKGQIAAFDLRRLTAESHSYSTRDSNRILAVRSDGKLIMSCSNNAYSVYNTDKRKVVSAKPVKKATCAYLDVSRLVCGDKLKQVRVRDFRAEWKPKDKKRDRNAWKKWQAGENPNLARSYPDGKATRDQSDKTVAPDPPEGGSSAAVAVVELKETKMSVPAVLEVKDAKEPEPVRVTWAHKAGRPGAESKRPTGATGGEAKATQNESKSNDVSDLSLTANGGIIKACVPFRPMTVGS